MEVGPKGRHHIGLVCLYEMLGTCVLLLAINWGAGGM